MLPRRSLPEDLLLLARRQAEVVSREQLIGFGVTDRVTHRLVADGRLERITRGVYATAAGGWTQQAWAGVLIGGPSAVLGGAAAAHLHGLVREPPTPIVVHTANWRPRDHRWRLVQSPRLGVGEPPRTRVAQTVIDLAAELEADDIVSVVAEAVGRKRVRPEELRRLLAETTRHPNRALVEDLLGEVAAGSRSPLEVRYARSVERAHGLPVADRQHGPLGRYQTDVWYREPRLLVELDGRAYHSGQAALNDMDRDNDHQLIGVRTLRFGWRQVTATPCQVAAKVARALRQDGWPGPTRTCPRCRTPL
ncbi:MAG: type IV toxin-antitoxin system AbiEi family antitoxin domain-containing protein [Propionicimonas sp.]